MVRIQHAAVHRHFQSRSLTLYTATGVWYRMTGDTTHHNATGMLCMPRNPPIRVPQEYKLPMREQEMEQKLPELSYSLAAQHHDGIAITSRFDADTV